MIEDLFHSEWKRTCFVAAPKDWRIVVGSPEMSMAVRPEPGTYFAQYGFSMTVSWAIRAIDPELFASPDAPLVHVKRPNSASFICDVENKRHSLTRGGSNFPEPMDSFLVNGEVPLPDYTIPLPVYASYEDGGGEEDCEIPVFTEDGVRTASISVDNVVDAYPEHGVESTYVVFTCRSNEALRKSSFDRLCSSLIAKVTREPDFAPDACVSTSQGFIWPRSDPEAVPMPWASSTVPFDKIRGIESVSECECLDTGGAFDLGTIYSTPERPESANVDLDARGCESDVRLSVAGSDNVLPLESEDPLRVASIRLVAGDFKRFRIGDIGVVRVVVSECESPDEPEG